MLQHEYFCAAVTYKADICTCGALFRAVLAPADRRRADSPAPRKSGEPAALSAANKDFLFCKRWVAC